MGEIIVLPLSKFRDNYPTRYFRRDSNGILHFNTNELNVFGSIEGVLHDVLPNQILIENTPECITSWKKRLTEKPIVLLITISRYSSGMEVCTAQDDFVVFLKTPHILLSSQITEAFCRCQRLQKQGKKFTLTVSVKHIVGQWYNSIVAQSSGICCMSGEAVSLTTYPSKNFEDNLLRNPLLCGGCLPCIVIFGFPYLIYRAVRYKHVKLELEIAEVYDTSLELARVRLDLLLQCGQNTRREPLTILDGEDRFPQSNESVMLQDDPPPRYSECFSAQPPPYHVAIKLRRNT